MVSHDLTCCVISIIYCSLAGVTPLVDAKDVEGLRKMYDLLDRVDALEPLKLAFAKSVEVRLLPSDLLLPSTIHRQLYPKSFFFRLGRKKK